MILTTFQTFVTLLLGAVVWVSCGVYACIRIERFCNRTEIDEYDLPDSICMIYMMGFGVVSLIMIILIESGVNSINYIKRVVR